ncbi:hypothetical protein G3T16_19400 [Kineobactrum salinum]|uniref:Uncharacterized protein n=1 Tax=Kineobactrum salinum TaxID=2708301 RepID=A0A6C0UAD9_9GAMM|nr:hypothetical protein G3T16_19400 [Kineobactrum salinum]
MANQPELLHRHRLVAVPALA